MKREKMLTIRVTDEEHARLLERCEGKRLAEWMRRVCLGEPVARTGKLPTLSPPLLRHLAAIGNNLNQTARKVNSGQWSSIDRVHVVAALMAIEGELRQLRQAVRERGDGMIVKFHARGKGGGSGPVDYLLGRERNREGATVPGVTRKKCGNSLIPRHSRRNTLQAFCRSRRRSYRRVNAKE